ncbi:MAG: PH domain-containing protein [Lachnospiraceae bacterium]
MSGNTLHITASAWKDLDISMEEIDSVTLEENITLGRRTYGIGNFKIRGGNFKNEAFGKYTLYSFNSNKTYIVIKTDEQFYVLNKSTELETEEFYRNLLEYAEAK